jgi:hypothetical protein
MDRATVVGVGDDLRNAVEQSAIGVKRDALERRRNPTEIPPLILEFQALGMLAAGIDRVLNGSDQNPFHVVLRLREDLRLVDDRLVKLAQTEISCRPIQLDANVFIV